MKKQQYKEVDALIKYISLVLIQSLGECIEGNDYEIIAGKDGKWWLKHKQVGSSEPLKEWIETELSK